MVTIRVIESETQSKSNVEFEWDVSSQDTRSVTFKLNFSTAKYVSMSDEPDILQIIVRDPYAFVGANSLPVQG